MISEKPLANSVAECDAMIAACREANVRFSVGYRLFFDPYHAELRRIAREGDFGPLLKMDGAFSFVFGPHAWRVEKKLAGGGPMMDLGIYVMKAARPSPVPGEMGRDDIRILMAIYEAARSGRRTVV